MIIEITHDVIGPICKSYNSKGQLHSYNDEPAVKFYRNKHWYKEGKLHRENGSAIECINGENSWYIEGIELTKKEIIELIKKEIEATLVLKEDRVETYNSKGQLHSFEDKPSLEYKNGDKYWHKEGKYHRENGPAIEWSNGHKEWYKNGRLHRENGPAIEYSNGDKHWYKESKLTLKDRKNSFNS